MNRIQIISQLDPVYGIALSEFVQANSIFIPFVNYAPLSLKRVLPSNVVTVKQCILYYICMTGRNARYGHEQYSKIFSSHFIQKQSVEETLRGVTQSKWQALFEALSLPENFTIQQFQEAKIKGIGTSGKTFVLSSFGVILWESVESTDLDFKKGLQKIYKLESVPTASQVKQIISGWKCKEYSIIGSILSTQAKHFSHG